MKTFLLLLLPAALLAQTEVSLAQGRALFRSNCAFCHGMTATGGRGPNLVSAQLSHGDTDEAIAKVIHGGVPGTTMPAFGDLDKDELAQIVGYLRSLSKGVVRESKLPGDPVAGAALYDRNGCSGCHRIGFEGSILGPGLSRVGASRSLEYLRESIVNPSADIPEEFESVTAVTRSGVRVRGIRINEDTFSLQLRDMEQKIRMFQKDQLREVVYEKQSLMPSYSGLPAADLDNLVSYLATLRGVSEGATATKAGGIK